MMTNQEKLAVIQAHVDGRVIEWRTRDEFWDVALDKSRFWTNRDTGHHEFNFSVYDYRVQPKPREWWIATDSVIQVVRSDKPNQPGYIHVREVIE